MELPIYNMAGEQIDEMELPADIFNAKINNGLMHQALVRQMANSRLGTHKAKGRSEVNHSTAKIYRQKGTGRARHGSRRAPIFVGGGVAHGPHPRSYVKKMPKKMRRAALRSALTVKAFAGDIVLVNDMTLNQPKTKDMVAALQLLVGDSSALVLLPEQNENVELSARNLPTVKTLRANYLNVRDLLGFGKVVIPLPAMEVITGFLGREDDEWFEIEEYEEDLVMAAEVDMVETDEAADETAADFADDVETIAMGDETADDEADDLTDETVEEEEA